MAKKPAKILGLDGQPYSKSAAKKADNLPRPAKRTSEKGTEFPAYLEPITDIDALPIPLLWRVLIQPIHIPDKTDGGIMLPETLIARIEYLRCVGRVVAVGPLAYMDETKFGAETVAQMKAGTFPVKKGAWVLFDQYAGAPVEINGQKFRRLNDDNIDAIIPKPEAIKFYY